MSKCTVERMKENRVQFYLLTSEESDVLVAAGKRNCLMPLTRGPNPYPSKWQAAGVRDPFTPSVVYRLKSDYVPKLGREEINWRIKEAISFLKVHCDVPSLDKVDELIKRLREVVDE